MLNDVGKFDDIRLDAFERAQSERAQKVLMVKTVK